MNQGISAYEIQSETNANATSTEINDNLFSHIDFGPLKIYLDDDNITDISYSNNGQVWLKSLDKGVYRVDNPGVNNELMEKIAFQCANIMGKTFNMASPFLDSESSELRMNFVHDSIARNGIAAVFRKTPAKIRLKKEKIIEEKYITEGIHDFLIDAVRGHCNIIVSGETGSGKTELVKYLASHTAENEKIVTIEDTLELHLDKIYPTRDIVAMKTNNIASYSDVLVTCMRQNPKWILLSEVRSAEAVTAVRNSISSGHNILSTIHADKASSIPYRLYSLLESNIDVNQFMTTIYRYIQLGVHVRARYDKNNGGFLREVCEVCEFHVTRENVPEYHIIYRKNVDGTEVMNQPTEYLIDYLEAQGVMLKDKDYLEKLGEKTENTGEVIDNTSNDDSIIVDDSESLDTPSQDLGENIEDNSMVNDNTTNNNENDFYQNVEANIVSSSDNLNQNLDDTIQDNSVVNDNTTNNNENDFYHNVETNIVSSSDNLNQNLDDTIQDNSVVNDNTTNNNENDFYQNVETNIVSSSDNLNQNLDDTIQDNSGVNDNTTNNEDNFYQNIETNIVSSSDNLNQNIVTNVNDNAESILQNVDTNIVSSNENISQINGFESVINNASQQEQVINDASDSVPSSINEPVNDLEKTQFFDVFSKNNV